VDWRVAPAYSRLPIARRFPVREKEKTSQNGREGSDPRGGLPTRFREERRFF
jgi:hypothetical protein